ncbi:MAG TPA: 4-hydroxythreonine-4-phosphate dehydrogenase PdxA [Thermodesulfobacteriota bacterium]
MKPVVAITMGDPAGIGPEIAARAAASPAVQAAVRPVIVGHMETLRRAAPEVADRLVPAAADRPGDFPEGRVGVLEVGLPRRPLPWGRLCAEGGEAAVAYVFAAIDHALAARVDAVATAPLNKEAMHLAGYRYPGHTEIFGERTGTPDVALMLAAKNLRVIHVTSHVSLRGAIDALSVPRIVTTVRLADRMCRLLGVARPRVAVAGLNPHNGEHGLFGDEEGRIIEPAVAAARAEGLDAHGPIAPDTVFHKALEFRQYDIVVCMYHDQGHIPFKTLNFDSGVNITAGLPIVRTSVDHGTAFDIAGRGVARPDSMAEAILMAGEMARARRGGAPAEVRGPSPAR